MKKKKKNNWPAKIKRTTTSILPISKKRKGRCLNCGTCCKLPKKCPFLMRDDQGKSFCKIYKARPLNCRKYPRNEKEFITSDFCGYTFD